MIKTPETSPNPDMPTIIPDTVANHTKTDVDMTYLKNNNIDDAIHQKLRKRDKYDTNMYKMYNLVVGKTNEKP